MTSYPYDVLQDIPLNAETGKIEKNFLINVHEPFLRPDDNIVLDRLYADYEVLARLQDDPGDFFIRYPLSRSFKVVKKFVTDSTTDDCIVTLSLPSRQKEKGLKLPPSITVRLVKVHLSTGEIEVLITSLLDPRQYPREDFKWIYHQRWDEETYLGQLKHHWDLEWVSSDKVNRIKQDFYASVFLSAFSLVLAAESAELVRTKRADPPTQYTYQLNKSVISSSVAMTVVKILLNRSETINTRVTLLQDLLVKALVPIRPDRSFERKKKPL